MKINSLNTGFIYSAAQAGRMYAPLSNRKVSGSENGVNLAEKVRSYKESDALRGLENGVEQTDSIRRFRDSYDSVTRISAASTSSGIKAVETSLLSNESAVRSASEDYVRENTPEIMISISSAGRAALQSLETMSEAQEKLSEVSNSEEISIEATDESEASVNTASSGVTISAFSADNIIKNSNSVSTVNTESSVKAESSAQEGRKSVSRSNAGGNNFKTNARAVNTNRAKSAYSFQMNYRALQINLR